MEGIERAAPPAPAPAFPTVAVPRPWGMELHTFSMFLHLSQLAGYVIPAAGWLLPIIMWATCRDLHPTVDAHGRIVINWIISHVLYGIVFFLLLFVLIGIPLFIALGICAVVFPIVGAVRANRGVVWDYPCNIHFLSVAPSGRERASGGLGFGLGCLLIIGLLVVGAIVVAALVFGFATPSVHWSSHPSMRF